MAVVVIFKCLTVDVGGRSSITLVGSADTATEFVSGGGIDGDTGIGEVCKNLIAIAGSTVAALSDGVTDEYEIAVLAIDDAGVQERLSKPVSHNDLRRLVQVDAVGCESIL